MFTSFHGSLKNGNFYAKTFGKAIYQIQNNIHLLFIGYIVDDNGVGVQNPCDFIFRKLNSEKYCLALNGQYKSVIYDANSQTLVLLQDTFGNEAIYYKKEKDNLIFSTRLKYLVEKKLDNLNQDYLVDFLSNGGPFTTKTPWIGVERLICGKSLIYREGKAKLVQPHRLELCNPLYKSCDEKELSEILIKLIYEAISPYKLTNNLGCEVSGGLDSSTIFYSLRKFSQEVQGISFTTDSDDLGDTSIINQLSQNDKHWTKINTDKFKVFSKCASPALEPGGESLFELREHYFNFLLEGNYDLVFTGLGGDQVFGSIDCPPIYDTTEIFRNYKEIKEWSKSINRPVSQFLINYALTPVIKHSLRLPIKLNQNNYSDISWLSKRVNKNHWDSYPTPRVKHPRNQYLLDSIYMMATTASVDWMQDSPAFIYNPLMYKPLVSFMLSIPSNLRITPSLDRILQRSSLVNILPDLVLKRVSKGSNLKSLTLPLIQNEFGEKTLNSEIFLADINLIKPEKWKLALERAKYGFFEDFPKFTATLLCEAWLKRNFS